MDPEHRDHQQWLGYVQPVGLVVSIPALVSAQAVINRNIAPDQQRMLEVLPKDKAGDAVPEIRDLPAFVQHVFGWEPDDLVRLPVDTLPERFVSLEVVLPEYHETLRPTYLVPEPKPKDGRCPWILLVRELPLGQPLDQNHAEHDRGWQATPQAKFERLLRETNIPAGLLCNGTHLRLVYAPRGESSGHITFCVADMLQVAGRPIFAGLHTLLCAPRLFRLPDGQRLPAILLESRKYQNTVSTQLAEQVLAALFELLRGFQSAHDQSHGQLLREVLERDPNHVYAGLLTTLLRLVFLLYAEDRGLISSDPVYANFYSVTGLFNRLREEAGRYPDTMDQRYGAWAQLLTLFRLIYSGGRHGGLSVPPRRGYLFDPERYPFLEGSGIGDQGSGEETTRSLPRVSDGVVFRVLNNLLILDGERLSYRQLDVEQIGSVYEAIMGFHLEVARGRSIAIKPAKAHGAPATINLEALLAVAGKDRAKWLKEQTDQTLTGTAAEELKSAATIEALVSALDRKVAKAVTPQLVPFGAMVLQPSDERRRSGSHYTPRSLTAPIVTTTLKPVLEQLTVGQVSNLPEKPGAPAPGGLDRLKTLKTCPTPEQLLDLKVCDPAMGSGAFLVETCRQLGDALVKSWHTHGCLPADIPADEDEILHARRLVAQRCLYGVDKNPLAVDLAKLSLWLATLAKDHPFTFLDHSLREGDSLVGLTREQIARFDWRVGTEASGKGKKKKAPSTPGRPLFADPIAATMQSVSQSRQRILAARDRLPYHELRQNLDYADQQLSRVRLAGDLVIAAFFSVEKDRDRENRLHELSARLVDYLGPPGRIELSTELNAIQSRLQAGLTDGGNPVPAIRPLHWDIEFPEVFDRDAAGFDAIVGNPPFAGKNTIGAGSRAGFLDWLKTLHEESHGNADLVAHFFRRAFNKLRPGGTFGLIATNTIAQGDTRSTGLRWICTHGGTIYSARRRYKWPGQAAVVVSVVHVQKAPLHDGLHPKQERFDLDGREVDRITAYLFHAGGHDDPAQLAANAGQTFQGSIVLGMGFTFDDTDKEGVANPISLMHELIAKDPRNAELIFPYIGGQEVNDSPTHAHHRFVINFREMTEQEARRWPDLLTLVETKVKPERMGNNREAYRRYWWHYAEKRQELWSAIDGLERVLVCPIISGNLSFAFLPAGAVFSHKLAVTAFSSWSQFAVLQSRPYDRWAWFFSSTMKDDLNYSISDCFETFPFPKDLESRERIERVGQIYYEYRSKLMIRNNEGLTKTYNRFHYKYETSPDILKLRELHASMDKAVLEAYGWHGLAEAARCEFLLDYEDEEDDEAEAAPSGKRQKKKPWRYRWPDEFRDEVLARLLALNAQRAEEERLAGQTAAAVEGRVAKPGPKKVPARKKDARAAALFDREQEQFYILMLLRAWNRPLTRHALDTGLFFMVNDDLRRARLGGDRKKVAKAVRVVDGLDLHLQELEKRGWIDIDSSDMQQSLRIKPTAPSTEAAPKEDVARIEEVRQVFEQERTRGTVTVTEERIDVSPDLVLTG